MKKKAFPNENERTEVYQEPMDWRDLFIEILKKEFARQQRRNSKLSMRQWAAKIGMSSGAISELLGGRRKVTPEKAVEIIEAAKVPISEQKRLLAHMGTPADVARVAPTREGVELIKDWVNHAICGLYELNAITVDAQVISDRLRVPLEEVERRTRTLVQRGLLKKSDAGKVFRNKENWDISLTLLPEEMREMKVKALDFAKHAIQNLESDKGLFLNYTFPGNSGQVEFIQQEIKKLLNSIDALSESEPRDELIRFSVQLFPICFKNEKKSSVD